MAGALRVCGTAACDGALLCASLGLHLLAAVVIVWLIVGPRLSVPAPRLIVDSVELTLAETESDIPSEATALKSAPAALQPVPETAPYLTDAVSPVALPEPPLPRISPLPRAPGVPAPELVCPERVPEDASLPEIALPPVQTLPSTEARTAAGATARVEAPRLVTDLSRLRKRYPSEARRNGWEGTVTLALEIAADGSLAAATIHLSSGHRVLDEAALRMIRSARFEGGPGKLLQPIDYRLK